MRKLSAQVPRNVVDTAQEVAADTATAINRVYMTTVDKDDKNNKKRSLLRLQKSVALLELRLAKLKVWIRQQELALNDAD